MNSNFSNISKHQIISTVIIILLALSILGVKIPYKEQFSWFALIYIVISPLLERFLKKP